MAAEDLTTPEITLQWRHNEGDGVSNHRRLDCLLNRLFRCRSKKTSKLRVTGLCAGNSPVTEFHYRYLFLYSTQNSRWWDAVYPIKYAHGFVELCLDGVILWIPIYQYGLTLITTWINNHVHHKVWDEFTYLFPAPWNFGYGQVISTHTLLDMWLVMHAGIEVSLYQRKGALEDLGRLFPHIVTRA